LFISALVIILLQTDIAFGIGDRFLGVQVANHEQGVIIQNIAQNSPATRVVDTSSGQYMYLEPGDVIQIVNGINVTTPEHFVQLIRKGPPVTQIRVLDIRNHVFRDILAMVGPPDEVAAFFNQRSSDFEDKRMPYISPETSRE
jgi:S1-C subfamily serine protease